MRFQRKKYSVLIDSTWYVHTVLNMGKNHYSNVIMGAMASQITSLTIVYLTVYSGADKKHRISASLASVRGIYR